MNINKNKFLLDVEEIRKTLDISMMEAVVYWCEARSIEVELVAHIIKGNKTLKSKIKAEAESINYLRKKGARLPV
jgi:hypothetical protein